MKPRIRRRRPAAVATPPVPASPRWGAVADRLATLGEQLALARAACIGFPGATDVDYQPLAPLLHRLVNNVGDPYTDGVDAAHTKTLEREVIDFTADLFGLPPDDRWGYVTSGGSESNLFGLHLAAMVHPGAMCYLSAAAHPSLIKATRLLGLPTVTARTAPSGAVDVDDLRTLLGQYRHRPAIVALTAGTTMTEAVDDIAAVKTLLHDLSMQAHHTHVDAALSGIPLALIDDGQRPAFHLADSICLSGHKFLGTPMPCGIFVTRASHQRRAPAPASYAGGLDSTLSTSRNGHAALALWYVITSYGRTGLHQRAEHARQLAAHALDALAGVGWPAWRNPHAFTVVIKAPPAEIVRAWALPVQGSHSHIITMPGVSTDTIEEFVAALQGFVTAGNGRLSRSITPGFGARR